MRTKVRTNWVMPCVTGHGDWYYLNNQWYQHYNFVADSDRDSFGLEKITYETNKEINKISPKSSWRVTKNCTHNTHEYKWIPFSGRFYGTAQYVDCTNWFFDKFAYKPKYGRTYTAGLDSSFNSRAFLAMKPDLESGLNLAQFIAELTDVKHLLTLFRKWNGFSSKIAETHLSWNFGVKPFISDVKMMYKLLADHQERIQDFLNRRGSVQKRYYFEREPLVEDDSGWISASSTTWYRNRRLESMKYNATMTYTYDCPELDTLSNKIKAYQDMLGLRLTPSLVWELVPFSFAVDWFFRVGDFLKAQEGTALPITVEVLDYSISYKTEWLITREWRYCTSTNTGGPYGYHVDFYSQGKIYQRKRCLPDSENTFINDGQYGNHQLALSASLIRLCVFGRRR